MKYLHFRIIIKNVNTQQLQKYAEKAIYYSNRQYMFYWSYIDLIDLYRNFYFIFTFLHLYHLFIFLVDVESNESMRQKIPRILLQIFINKKYSRLQYTFFFI